MSKRDDDLGQMIVVILGDGSVRCALNERTERSPIVIGAGVMMAASSDRTVGKPDNEGRFVRVIPVPRARAEDPFSASTPRARSSDVQTISMKSEPAIDVERSAGRPPILIRRRRCWDHRV